MLASKWVAEGIDILLAAFTVYLFFFYFRIFFKKRGNRLYVLSGVIVILFWHPGQAGRKGKPIHWFQS